MKYIWGVFTAISLALFSCGSGSKESVAVSYTHLRAHETGRNLVCRLLLEKKKKKTINKKKEKNNIKHL